MKKLVSLLLSLVVVSGVSFAAPKFKAKDNKSVSSFKEFKVYTEDASKENHFIPSGWMGDTKRKKLYKNIV